MMDAIKIPNPNPLKKRTGIDILNIVLFVLFFEISYLHYNAYPAKSPEAVLFFALFVALLFISFLVLKRLGQEWIFYAFLFFLFFDMTIGATGHRVWTENILPSGNLFLSASVPHFILRCAFRYLPSRYVTEILAWALSAIPFFFLGFLLRKKIAGIMLGFVSVMFVTTVIKCWTIPEPLFRIKTRGHSAGQTKDKPNIIIFVLDEYIGVEGIPVFDQDGKELKATLIEDFKKNGFDLYGRAYSNYFDTRDSLSSIFNYRLFESTRRDSRIAKFRLPANKLLTAFHEKGYALHIYQHNGLDFCGALENRYRQCLEYKANAAGYLKNSPVPVRDRFFILLDSFFKACRGLVLKEGYSVLSEALWRTPVDRVTPLASVKVLEKIQKDLAQNPGGTVFFAHLLLPHNPYIYDAECRIKPAREWRNRWKNRDQHGEAYNTEETWERNHRLYAQQISCLEKKLNRFFDAMRQMGIFEKAVIVLFGDHGSRIVFHEPTWENRNKMTPRDFVDSFSNFLAIKKSSSHDAAERGEGKYHKGKIPAARVIGDFFNLPREGESAGFDKVYLRSRKTRALHPCEMPDF